MLISFFSIAQAIYFNSVIKKLVSGIFFYWQKRQICFYLHVLAILLKLTYHLVVLSCWDLNKLFSIAKVCSIEAE